MKDVGNIHQRKIIKQLLVKMKNGDLFNEITKHQSMNDITKH